MAFGLSRKVRWHKVHVMFIPETHALPIFCIEKKQNYRNVCVRQNQTKKLSTMAIGILGEAFLLLSIILVVVFLEVCFDQLHHVVFPKLKPFVVWISNVLSKLKKSNDEPPKTKSTKPLISEIAAHNARTYEDLENVKDGCIVKVVCLVDSILLSACNYGKRFVSHLTRCITTCYVWLAERIFHFFLIIPDRFVQLTLLICVHICIVLCFGVL